MTADPSANLDVLPENESSFGFEGLAPRTPGADTAERVLGPGLTADGSIAFTAADGEVLGPFWVERAWAGRVTVSGWPPTPFKEPFWSAQNLELFVTERRVAYRTTQPEGNGHLQAGHVRYSWIANLAFRGHQNRRYGCELAITTNARIANPRVLTAWINVNLAFPREFDSGALTRDIVQRLARHNLTQPDLPQDYREPMMALLSAPRLPDPPKKQIAEYDIPTSRLWPGSPEWMGGGGAEGQ